MLLTPAVFLLTDPLLGYDFKRILPYLLSRFIFFIGRKSFPPPYLGRILARFYPVPRLDPAALALSRLISGYPPRVKGSIAVYLEPIKPCPLARGEDRK